MDHCRDCKFQYLNRDYGAEPFVLNVSEAAAQNKYFRSAIWTGKYMQMTLMSIPEYGEIGWEIHEDTDQMLRIEQGKATLLMGERKGCKNFEKILYVGDAVLVPAGTWHNIINAMRCPLKISSIYAPPHHPKGTIHRTREEAERTSY